MRKSKIDYYLTIAKNVAERATCSRRKFGAVLIKNDSIISCYDDKTEVLTDNGWLFFKDLKKNEKIATLNSQTNELEYQYPTEYIIQDYIGKMYNIHTKQLDFCVTDGHFMYVSKAYMKNKKRFFREFERIKASDVFGKRVKYKRDCIWKGENKDFFILPEYVAKIKNQWKHPSVNIPMDLWLEFLGYYLAEGTVVCSGRLSRITIHTDWKDRFREDMFLCCKKIATILGRSCNSDKRGRINIDDERLYHYLLPLGKALTKFIPREYFSLSKEQLNILLKSLVNGDGADRKYGSIYFSSSERLIDNVSELAFKCGYCGTKSFRIAPPSTLKDGRIISSKNKNWMFGFTNNRPTPDVYKDMSWDNTKNIECWIDYEGKVYCVTVPNHIIYVRRNGRAVWCGNTGYNGSARGTLNCGEDVPCLKDISGELPLVSYDTCPAVHAEQNCIIQSDPDRRIGATMFLASSNSKTGDRPCHLCRRYIIQSGIGDIYFIDKNEKIQHEVISQWIEAEDKWMLNIQKLHTGRDRPLTL